ncbi:GDP-mannose-dependent alpha-mannosyltransferase [Aspergillus lentulus]|nr:GDP-mannose-dependent alpha-mannosyltransferase [Aspergillus lentulus]
MDRESFPRSLKGKKVLLTTESLGPVNGVSRTTGSLIDYLRRNEVDLIVVAPQFAGAQQAEQPVANSRLPGYPLPYNPDLTLVYPFRLKDVYKEPVQPDIVYVASPASLGFQLLLYLRQLRKPPVVLLNFQTDLSAYSEIILPTPLSRWSVWLLAVVQGFLFSNPAVHTIFYPSSYILDYLKMAGAPVTRAVKLGRGVDTILFNPSRRDEAYRKEIAPNGEIILVCVCRLAPEKGFEFLAVAAAKLAEEKLPFKLLIVGGNRNPEVETKIHRLFDHVRDHVVFTGFLTGEPLARAYASADLFLHCSITETFGLVVLEAMASGLPVIARNQGGPSDIVRHQETGYLVPPNDMETFVALVRQISRDSQLLSSLAVAARAYAEDTTWEKINRRVAWQMADAVEAREQTKRVQLEGQGRWCAAYEKAKDRTILALVQRIRPIAAFGLVCFMWMISVVPLIIHGSRIIPRGLAHIRGLASLRK